MMGKKIGVLLLSAVLLMGCKASSANSVNSESGDSGSGKSASDIFSIEGIRYQVDTDGTILIKGNIANNTDEYMSLIHVFGYAYDTEGKKCGDISIDGMNVPAHDVSGYLGNDAYDQFTETDISADKFAGIIFNEYSYFDKDNTSSADMRGSVEDIDYPREKMELWQK